MLMQVRTPAVVSRGRQACIVWLCTFELAVCSLLPRSGHDKSKCKTTEKRRRTMLVWTRRCVRRARCLTSAHWPLACWPATAGVCLCPLLEPTCCFPPCPRFALCVRRSRRLRSGVTRRCGARGSRVAATDSRTRCHGYVRACAHVRRPGTRRPNQGTDLAVRCSPTKSPDRCCVVVVCGVAFVV